MAGHLKELAAGGESPGLAMTDRIDADHDGRRVGRRRGLLLEFQPVVAADQEP